MKYNPRYVAYSTSHGKTPEEMLEYDRKRYPGGCNAGFLLWIQENIREYKSINPQAFVVDSLHDHEGFTNHLFSQVGKNK